MTAQLTTLSSDNYKSYWEQAVSYEQYRANFETEMNAEETSKYSQYLPQNWRRQSRLDRKLKLSDALQSTVHHLRKPVKWLLITEHWCGDASQINPVIAKAAAESEGNIELKLIYRDEHEALIDAHLTNGKSRSIPILLQIDANYNVTGSYGPRPAEAQQLVLDIKADGGDYNTALHTWYAKDKQQGIQQDLVQLLEYSN